MYDPTICSYRSGAIVRVVARDASIPGRTPIAKDSLKSGNALGSETFAATGQRVSTWDKFMLKVNSEK